MEQDENSLNEGESLFSNSPTPLYAKRILNAHRGSSDPTVRVKISGAEMSDIYRAYHGRLNVLHRRPEDRERVCNDAMELLDQIVIFRGCEPSVIISYVALVREVYLHACTNLKEKDINVQERKTKMSEQWKQIERHFAKIKYAMIDCWPVGNESDLMAAYVSIALLYSVYKDVSDESIIKQCYEAAERARHCDPGNLSESQFNEVQQYCDTIENIFFLRHQRSATQDGESRNPYVNNADDENDAAYLKFDDNDNSEGDQLQSQSAIVAASANLHKRSPESRGLGRIKDGPAILAEYGRLTTAENISAGNDKRPHKRLRPSDFEIKNTQKRLEQRNSASPTILTEFEAILTACNATTDEGTRFPRPSDLKLIRNSDHLTSAKGTQDFDPTSNSSESKFGTSTANQNSSSASPTNVNLKIMDLSPKPSSPLETKNDTVPMAGNISNNADTSNPTLSQVADENYLAFIVQDQIPGSESAQVIEEPNINSVLPKLDSYVNNLVEEIIRTVTEVSDGSSRRRSRRNSETIQKIDTVQSTVFISSSDSVPKRENALVLNSENQAGGQNGISKNITIHAKRILKENIDQQIENIIFQSANKKTSDTDSSNEYGEKKKSRLVVIEGYAEMALNDSDFPGSLYNLQQTSFEQNRIGSDSCAPVPPAEPRIRSTSPSVVPESITTIVLSTSANSSNQAEEGREQTDADSLIDTLEELSGKTEEVQKLFSNKDEVQTYVVLENRDQQKRKSISSVVESEKKFNKVLETRRKLEHCEEQHPSSTFGIFQDFQYADDNIEITDEDGAVATETIHVGAKAEDNRMKEPGNRKISKPKSENLINAEGKCIVTGKWFPRSDRETALVTIINVADKNASEARRTINETVFQAAAANSQQPSVQKEIPTVVPTRSIEDSGNSVEDVPMQKLCYTSDMPFTEITPNVIKNLLMTLEKFDACQAKSQNKRSEGGELFKSYARFEPAFCSLQKVPEIDACPLPMKPLVQEYRPQLHAVPAGGWETLKQKSLLSESTKAKQYHVLPTPREVSTTSQSHANTAAIIVGQKPVITEFEISKSITSKHKTGTEESSRPKIKSILKRTIAKTESLFSKLDNKYRQHETTPINSSTVVPEVRQKSSCELDITPPGVPQLHPSPPREEINEKRPVSLKPQLPSRPEYLPSTRKQPVQKEKAKFLKSQLQPNIPNSDKEYSNFIASGTCQASTSQKTETYNVPEPTAALERAAELPKHSLDCNPSIADEKRPAEGKSPKTGAIWSLANKLSVHKSDDAEQTTSSQTPLHSSDVTTNDDGVMQVPHFDAKAEFERRLSERKKCRGEVPVIVRKAKLRSGNQGRLPKQFTKGPLISSAARLSANEKPDFNFIIKRDDDNNENAAVGISVRKGVGSLENLEKERQITYSSSDEIYDMYR